ncbi:MAG TPA: hypothetical protein VFX55_18315 [Duganella sp.]|nr:hypothetical protein [Duganella sp.]
MDFNKRLLRHLALAVLVKLALLTVLWWAWVRDARVALDADQIAQRIGAAGPHSGEKK